MERPGQVPFEAHVELLRLFIAHRREIVERIQDVLNAQRKPSQYLQDRALLRRLFEDCFFALGAVTDARLRLRGQLEEAHWASGFKPRPMPGLHNDLIEPAEMMIRGFYCWQQTRWPGRNGRVRYAQTLFGVYVIRCLELLAMRVWDAGASGAGERLAQVQAVLDELWRSTPADQPVLVRDARWLIPLAQSPTTDDLAAYFHVSERIAESFSEEDHVEIRKASVCMIGGHLRSQIRHYCLKDRASIDEKSVILRTRTSNALDLALLIQGLVPLLEAYERARQSVDGRRSADGSRSGDGSRSADGNRSADGRRNGEGENRLALAGLICQALSPDPELFLNRLELLRAYSMTEPLFVTKADEGRAVYTPMGLRHVRLLSEYEALIGRLSKPLYEDCLHFRPVAGSYSPYGAIYGTPSNLTEHMALRTLAPDVETRFSLEDVFVDGEADKLAWVNGWRKLPHIEPVVQRQFDYPQQFAEEIFARIERALRRSASSVVASEADAAEVDASEADPSEADPSGVNASVADPSPGEVEGAARIGRLFVLGEGDLEGESKTPSLANLPELPARYVRSSDRQIVAAQKAEYCDQAKLLLDRQEGMFLVSYETAGGWAAITKDVLTEVVGAGRDAKIVGLPSAAAEALALLCPGLIAP